ncbi:elongation factor P [Helicobacter pylori]|uniref:Elongation factor P n=18 Tax=Helicobacter pylori TaxID=210 RepID=EFP_HELP2|nr:elongation factor P [Helicobacter pylori]B6JPS3.1 RecName: Full=Elongation factor P; Short=EF-P [Helicobacter pylori P12]Q1CUY2.1 RecName: Full=Elongation factor P; Short=EF-P [Helicobacter pylori HPAG1]AGT73441.1 translation elongation factor P [Helicobacter pylori SouthAfrica20]EJB37823.1 translation elongation factor P [Helicobacter pylori NQ4044]EJB40153.1 translation elongation factor P [Helicobacter pylori NQ4161]EQD89407.1 translation elongation factor P [Helicobacter pylori SouthAf
MAIGMSELKKGLKIELGGVPYRIVEYQHVKPGKGAAFVRAKIKSFLDGKVIEKTFHAGDKCEEPNLVEKTMQYLYHDGDTYQFMDIESYEQIALNDSQVGEASKWMLDGMQVQVLLHNDKAISVDVPQVVALKIVETAPNFKGDTSSASKKPATLETGAVVQVPFHVLEGEVIKVNTETEEYLEKVK